jgi:hypothetical protein
MPALGVRFPVGPLLDGSNQLQVADPPAALRVALRADIGNRRLAFLEFEVFVAIQSRVRIRSSRSETRFASV